jgi:transposase
MELSGNASSGSSGNKSTTRRACLDGKYLIATSDPAISAEDTALGYKNLLEAERGFRDLKSTMLLRPVFHRLEHRIRAHVQVFP